MAYLIQFFTILLYSFILLIPLWIRAVSRASIPVITRRWIIVGMVIISIASTLYAVFRPHSPHLPTIIIGSILSITYLLIVLGTCFMSWPRSWPRQGR